MKILIIDDHPLFLEGIGMVLRQIADDVEAVELDSGNKGMDYLKSNPDTDLVLVDLDMPVMSGFDFLQVLEDQGLTIPVAILSATTNLYDVKRAVDMGAVGFISKTSDTGEMKRALETIFEGDVYIPKGLEEQLDALMASESMDPQSVLRAKAKAVGITNRQHQVLQLLAKGYTNKKIGEELNLTERTVKAHVSALFAIMNVANRTECVLEGDRLGLTHMEEEQNKPFTLADE
jgi:DNA-binding NarL/FixJ family response regulator